MAPQIIVKEELYTSLIKCSNYLLKKMANASLLYICPWNQFALGEPTKLSYKPFGMCLSAV